VELIAGRANRDNSGSMHRAQLEAEVVALYHGHASELLRFAACLARNEDLARDAVQETFLRYFAERLCGRIIEHPRAWLYQVQRNYLLNRLNSAAATRETAEEELSRMTDPEDDPESRMQRTEMAVAIARTLSARERECLGFRTGGLAYREIADLMGLRPGTVGALLARAHQKIRSAAEASRAGDLEVAAAVRHLFQGGAPRPAP